jgi:hypothetical protein
MRHFSSGNQNGGRLLAQQSRCGFRQKGSIGCSHSSPEAWRHLGYKLQHTTRTAPALQRRHSDRRQQIAHVNTSANTITTKAHITTSCIRTHSPVVRSVALHAPTSSGLWAVALPSFVSSCSSCSLAFGHHRHPLRVPHCQHPPLPPGHQRWGLRPSCSWGRGDLGGWNWAGPWTSSGISTQTGRRPIS